ncbi:MAG TPA: hypothetical protein PKH10_06010 [bacterium]|nr:hypothetical protein [bacterium]
MDNLLRLSVAFIEKILFPIQPMHTLEIPSAQLLIVRQSADMKRIFPLDGHDLLFRISRHYFLRRGRAAATAAARGGSRGTSERTIVRTDKTVPHVNQFVPVYGYKGGFCRSVYPVPETILSVPGKAYGLLWFGESRGLIGDAPVHHEIVLRGFESVRYLGQRFSVFELYRSGTKISWCPSRIIDQTVGHIGDP